MDECVVEKQEEQADSHGVSWRTFEAFLDALSPQARHYVLDWLVLPWTVEELLEGEPGGEAVWRELMDLGVIVLENGVWDLHVCCREGFAGEQ